MENLFKNRLDAGRRLGEKLIDYQGQDTIILTIPRGGVPVGYEVALRLRAPLDLIIPRKLPIPWNPEAGFGAVTAEGTIVINEAMVEPLGLEDGQIHAIAQDVREEIHRREKEFRGDRPPINLKDKTVILVDDGIASGYTMLAAIKSVRLQNPRQVIAAAPTASINAVEIIKPEVEKMVTLIVSQRLPYAVADFYLNWCDIDDSEVKDYLSQAEKDENANSPPPACGHEPTR